MALFGIRALDPRPFYLMMMLPPPRPRAWGAERCRGGLDPNDAKVDGDGEKLGGEVTQDVGDLARLRIEIWEGARKGAERGSAPSGKERGEGRE